jgi:hypothetical protein
MFLGLGCNDNVKAGGETIPGGEACSLAEEFEQKPRKLSTNAAV